MIPLTRKAPLLRSRQRGFLLNSYRFGGGGGGGPLAEIQLACRHYWNFDEADTNTSRVVRLDKVGYWSLIEQTGDDVTQTTGLRGSGYAARLPRSSTGILLCPNRGQGVGSTQSFTVAGWVRLDAFSATVPWTIFREAGPGTAADVINAWIVMDNGGTPGSPYQIAAVTRGSSSGDYAKAAVSESIVEDVWYFVQAQRDHTTGKVRLRIDNGAWVETATTVSNFTGTSSICFGATPAGSNTYTDLGQVDLQYWGYYDSILSDAALDYLYDSGNGRTSTELGLTPIYTDPHFGYVRALLHFDVVDGSTAMIDQAGGTYTASGNAQLDTSQSKFGSASLLLDGVGDYISRADDGAMNFGSLFDLTMQGFFQIDALNNDFGALVGNGNPSFGSGAVAVLACGTSGPIPAINDRLLFADSSGGSSITGTTPLSGLSAGFHHWSLVRSNGTLTLYLDGGVEGSASSSNDINFSSNGFNIGRNGWDGAESFFQGRLDEVRVTFGIAEYTAPFSPPSIPFADS